MKTGDGKLSCQGFIYEPGKTYKHEGEIELCKSGFHACHELWQVWPFYPNNGENVFYEVECGGKIIESDEGDGKFVCSEITLINEVNVSKIAKFDYASIFRKGFARVGLNNKRNFIDTEGKLLSEQWFDYAWSFSEGSAMVEFEDKYNFVNTEGKLLSELWFNDACWFSEGFAKVKLFAQWMKIDKNGNLLEN